MAERPSKRSRVSSEDSEGTDDWLPQAMSMNNRSGQPSAGGARARRAAADPEAPSRSIRLNIKAPPTRLTEITGDSSEAEEDAPPPGRKNTRRSLGRSSKNRKPIVDKSSDDEEDEEEDAPIEAEEDDEQDEDDDEDEPEDEDDEAAGDDGDISMADEPVPVNKPTIKLSNSNTRDQKPTATARLKASGVTPVEDKEADSMLDSDEEDDDDDPEEDPPDLQNMPDDDEMNDTIRAEELADSDLDSSDAEAAFTNNMTKRRRDADPDSLMALSNEAQKKKFFTSEEISMRRAEMARRRKDLSEKRNEEEKNNTLKRLLEKPVPTRRSRAQVLADAEREEFGPGRGASAEAGEDELPKPKATFVRTVAGGRGVPAAGVPHEWLGTPAGRVFGDAPAQKSGAPSKWDADYTRSGRMVQAID